MSDSHRTRSQALALLQEQGIPESDFRRYFRHDADGAGGILGYVRTEESFPEQTIPKAA